MLAHVSNLVGTVASTTRVEVLFTSSHVSIATRPIVVNFKETISDGSVKATAERYGFEGSADSKDHMYLNGLWGSRVSRVLHVTRTVEGE